MTTIKTIKPSATVVAQFAANVETEAILHNGKLFLPCMDITNVLGDMTSAPSAPKAEAKKSEPVVEEDSDEKGTSYTEEELMDMDVKELTKILKGLGIDPSQTPGKNTNKKLRELVLQAQEGSDEEEEEAPVTEKTASKKSKAKEEPADDEEEEATSEEGTTVETVVAILEDFDSGKLNLKKATTKVAEVFPDADAEAITELINEFSEDADIDLDEHAAKMVEELGAEKKPARAKRGAAKEKPAAKKSKAKLVDADDLEVGNKVSVYWEDQEEWFDGEVESIKKGKVTIAYEDGTAEVLDDNNTKIKLLS